MTLSRTLMICGLENILIVIIANRLEAMQLMKINHTLLHFMSKQT